MPRKRLIVAPTQRTVDYQFEVKQGIQCRTPYWMSTLTVSQIQQMFTLDRAPGTHPLDIAQRLLNLSHARKITKYLLNGLLGDDGFYVLPTLTVSVDATEFNFETISDGSSIGKLTIPHDGIFSLCDGQHRAKAMLEAILAAPAMMANESIGVMFIPDPGGNKRKRIFLAINQHGTKPNKSLITLFDEEDDLAEIARKVMVSVPIFVGHIAYESTSVKTSKPHELFALAALRESCKYLVQGYEGDRLELAVTYWNAIAQHQPDWQSALEPETDLTILKQRTISFHSITLNALGLLGYDLMQADDWQQQLTGLSSVNWTASNPDWQKVFMIPGGGVVKTRESMQRYADYLKNKLGAT